MTNNKMLSYGWSAIVAILMAVAAVYFLRGIPLDTNILHLLPKAERDPLAIAAVQRHNEASSRNIAFLLSAASEELSQQAASQTTTLLESSGLFGKITGHLNEQQGYDLYRFYLPYRANLLSAQDRELLLENRFDTLQNRVIAGISSPASGFNAGMLEQDPLLLFANYLSDMSPPAGNLKLRNGMLTAEQDGKYHTLVSALINDDPFSLSYQQKFSGFYMHLESTLQSKYAEVTLTSVGMVHNAHAGTERAKSDISLISTISMIGLFLLFAFGFRSLRPLLYASIPMMIGIVVAIVVCATIFQSIHIMTLVFGTSLIGVCMDYALHFFTERAYRKPTPTPQQCLANIIHGMTLGMFTSVIGYTAFFTTGFPGLQQMALFSATGLVTAYCCVVFWFPRLPALPINNTDHFSLSCAQTILAFWGHRRKLRSIVTLLMLALFAASGIMLAEVDDDVRSLDNSPQSLHQDRLKFQKITGISPATQFFMVSGNTPDEVLEREEMLTDILRQHVLTGTLQGFRATTNYIPSAKRQRENREIARTRLLPLERLSPLLAGIGYHPDILRKYTEIFSDSEATILSFNAWRNSTTAESTQWLEPEPGRYASLVYLLGIGNVEQILQTTASLENIDFIDPVSDINAVLMKYRQLTNGMIFLAYSLIGLILIWRYGLKRAFAVLVPPLLAAATAFGIFGYIGQALTLFNSLAILLVLGLGIDYTIFLAENQDDTSVTMIAVLYSTVTTVLSFGLLGLSSTPALKSIGMTVLFGIIMTFVLAPLAISGRKATNSPPA